MSDFITSTEAAEILGVSVRRVRVLSDRLGGQKLGRDLLFPRQAVQEFARVERAPGNRSGKPRHHKGRPRKGE